MLRVGRASLTPLARRQLDNIWDHISQDSPKAADDLLARIFDKLELAADNIGIGTPRPTLRSDARALIIGPYIALYIPDADGISVIAVVHGMREPKNWFD